MTDADNLIKSNQEQAVAAGIDLLNQIRLDRLVSSLKQQDVNLETALSSIKGALNKIARDVIDVNRGGQKGMHGFIAEIAEEGVGNARRQILGKKGSYRWVNDNGPVDLLRDGVAIQQKFVAAGGRFGLGAIADHLEKNPNFIRGGGKYQLPSDHFEVIQRLRSMTSQEAGVLLGKTDGGPSYKDWQRIQSFFEKGDIPFDSLEPSTLKYAQAQRGTYKQVLESEQDSIHGTDRIRRNASHQQSRPSLKQAAQATAVAGAFEAGTALVVTIIAKLCEGKKLKDFSAQDWREIASEGGLGVVKGSVRGLSIYTLTNYTPKSAAAYRPTPGAVASAIVTAAFSIAEQANMLRRGEINEQEFIKNAELVTLEAAVSALSSFVGQALIPIPVLGAVIGNTVGIIMYQSVASSLSRREAELIEQYLEEQRMLDERLAGEYRTLLEDLEANMTIYVEILDRAFSPDVQVSLEGSIELALSLNVPVEEILDSEEKARSYFLD